MSRLHAIPAQAGIQVFGSALDGAKPDPDLRRMTARVALVPRNRPLNPCVPYCYHEETQVVETRESDEGDVIRRRRRCLHCDKRFTTYERSEIAMPSVVKKDGTRADFDRAKMRASMMLALRKRPVSVEQVDAALERIEDKLLATGAREVPRPGSASW